MTQSLGTWGDPDSITFYPFTFYGETFHARGPTIPTLRAMKRKTREAQAAAAAGGTDEIDALDVIVDLLTAFVSLCLTPAERDRWQTLVADPDIEIQLADLRSLSSKISGLGGGDPLDSAPSGSMLNGATSEGGSSSPDYTTAPIPTS